MLILRQLGIYIQTSQSKHQGNTLNFVFNPWIKRKCFLTKKCICTLQKLQSFTETGVERVCSNVLVGTFTCTKQEKKKRQSDRAFYFIHSFVNVLFKKQSPFVELDGFWNVTCDSLNIKQQYGKRECRKSLKSLGHSQQIVIELNCSKWHSL